MFSKKASKLVLELDQFEDIRPFDEALVREVLEEMRLLYEANLADSKVINETDNATLVPSIQYRHLLLNRDKRCILAYLYNRMRKLRQIRWELGAVLPPEITANLFSAEVKWFQTYNKALATYMKSIGPDCGYNLTTNVLPPKSLYIEVKCLVDYGKLELDNEQTITLKKNSCYLLPRSACESLIRRGILEQHNI